VTFYTVKSGDTWESIAAAYDADLVVLHKVNPVTLAAGTQIKIPVHSAGTGGVAPIPGTATATATATPTATGTTTTAQRITIPAGQTTYTLAGAINAGQTVQYVLNTAVGQVLNINLSDLAGTEATLGVTGPTGLAVKPADGSFTWNTTITTGGDYYISVTGLAGVQSNKGYTLTVSLTTPAAATATFTATSTSTPVTPGSQ
jgi:LysM repeat protein